MNDQAPLPIAEAAARRRRPHPPRARVYLRLLWAVPGIVMLIVGMYVYNSVEDDGTVDRIRLTTKPGPVGQVSEAKRLIDPGNPDLYLRISVGTEEQPRRTAAKTDTPVGNGLEWKLRSPVLMSQIKTVDVWDEDLIRDNFKDHITMGTWIAEGQTYRIELLGERFQPPKWALPVALAGGGIVLLVFLRFVWDQVI